MKRINIHPDKGYMTPLCVIHEILAEGTLCVSLMFYESSASFEVADTETYGKNNYQW